MGMKCPLYLNNNNVVAIENLRDSITGIAINDAVGAIQVYLQDRTTTVSSAILIVYTAGSQGNYTAVITTEVPLAEGVIYAIRILITYPAPLEEWMFRPATVRVEGSCGSCDT
jgi:hypothetical protein